jgi:hypothetical protein
LIKVTVVVCPVGRRIVGPGKVPLNVHILVLVPGRIWISVTAAVREMFELVKTLGMTSGLENAGTLTASVGATATTPRDVPTRIPAIRTAVRRGCSGTFTASPQVGMEPRRRQPPGFL